MTPDEKKFLSDLLNILNHLFRHEVDFMDVHPLMFATANCFANTEYSSLFDETLKAFETLDIADRHKNLQIDDSSPIAVINDLRQFLADFFI